jgi:glycine oxidase
MASVDQPDLLIVGGGVIGLSVAWLARARGMAVTVLDRGPIGRGASHVAAGMIAPVAEVEFGPAGRRLLDLSLRSAAMWRDFSRELQDACGLPVQLHRIGTLLLARDEDEALELERQLAFRQSLDLDVRRLRPSAARELEPALAPTLRLALEVPDDHAVDPRQAVAALHAVCEASGVSLREHHDVAELAHDGMRVQGVRLRSGELIAAETVLIAAGAWTDEISGLPVGARVPVRPVKGQIMRLRDPAGPGLLQRVVRYEGGYLVPRGDGRYVLGATVEERGFDIGPTAGGVYELLRDAWELVPGVLELEIEELLVGMRPGSPDNLPSIGRGDLEGLLWATGHHRNGIMLAPLTAELVMALLDGDGATARGEEAQTGEMLAACDPLRFTAQRAAEALA